MKTHSVLFASALIAAASLGVASAESIASFTDSVSVTDPTQLGRPSRSGTPQTWTGQEVYTGVISPATTYHYKTYTFAASNFVGAPYIDVSVFDEANSGLFFVSAFAGSYSSAAPGANWLGDEGSSGNLTFYGGTLGDARDFEFVLPSNQNLVLLVNTTGGGASGTGQLYDIAINAYADTQFSDPVPVAATPEPGTWLLTLSGLLGMAVMARRKFSLEF